MKNPILGMPILPRTKGGGCPPATANLQFIEVPENHIGIILNFIRHDNEALLG